MRYIDYVWRQKWDTMTVPELEAERVRVDKLLNSLTHHSFTVKASLGNVLADLEQYLVERAQKAEKR